MHPRSFLDAIDVQAKRLPENSSVNESMSEQLHFPETMLIQVRPQTIEVQVHDSSR